MKIALRVENNIITGYLYLQNQDYSVLTDENFKIYAVANDFNVNIIRTGITLLEDIDATLAE